MAGVSTATVSRVINQTAWVEPVTRERVEKAMQLYQGITPQPSSNHFNAELVIRDSVAPYFSR